MLPVENKFYKQSQDLIGSEKEINEIFNNMISTHTLYKLGAYMIALYNQPESFEAWKTSIVEDVGGELPEDECLELWKAYQEVDY